MTNEQVKEKAQEILEGVPEAQIAAGYYIKKIGRKYVHVLNTWETTKIEKVDFQEFAQRFL